MKVFISSTYEDLKDYRLTVREAILRLKHHPIGMDDLARPDESKTAALEVIEGCDAFVGIYSHRYGPIPHGQTLSIVEQEFDRARARGIPCFCYRVDPEFPWPSKFVERGQAKEKLDAFLKKATPLLRGAFMDPINLAMQVATDLGRELPTPPSPSATSPSPLSHTPFPPASADFTGRRAEIDQLCAQMTASPGAAINGVAGMGGIGKTALALVVAHRLTPRYPDAQIYIDLKGTSTTPLSSTEAMLQIIHALDPAADLRHATEEDIAAQYRGMFKGKCALLLLDNAADAAQVRPLLPPLPSAVLVTSRHHFSVLGLPPLNLDVLSPAEARELVLKLCPRLGDQADGIARLCGYLPLALRIAATILARQPDLDPVDYVARLADQRTRLATLKPTTDPDADLEATFNYSYELLSPEAQARWRMLAVFPAPFDALAAGDVWGIQPEAANDLLGLFVRASLVDDYADSAYTGYILHDLLTAFADARLGQEERATAQARYAQHYRKVAAGADAVYLKGGDFMRAALKAFDVKWPHIRAGQAWAAANMGVNKEALRLCNEYPDAAAFCLDVHVRATDRIAWREAAVAAAHRLGDRRMESYHLGNLGNAYHDLGETRKAIEYHEQALAIRRALVDRHGEGLDLGNLGNAYSALGETRKAIEYYEQAVAIQRVIGDRRAEGNQLANLGNQYAKLGETRKAIEYHEQALAIQRAIGNRLGEAQALGGLGNACLSLGETSRAIQYYEQVLAMQRALGNRQGEGNALGNLGIAYENLGEARKAIEYYEQTLAIQREIGDRRGEGNALFNLSLAHEKQGDLSQAIQSAEAALALYVAIESPKAEQARRWLEKLKQQQQTK